MIVRGIRLILLARIALLSCCAAQSSALGTLSVVEALKVMSMESLVATKRKNDALMAGIADSKMCKFVSKDL